MEADWAVEAGGGAARIEAGWAGLVDLRGNPADVEKIVEAREHPALGAALVALNGPDSPVFTSKCDVWGLVGKEIDPLEFDCAPDEVRAGLASYVDVVTREPRWFGSFAEHEAWVRRATLALRETSIRQGRVDLVVRAAAAGGADGFGLTLYAAGCGVDSSLAEEAWGKVLRAAVMATMREARASSSIG